MLRYFRHTYLSFFSKLSIFTLLIAFFAYISFDMIQILSDTGKPYAFEVNDYDGGEEENNNESEDEIKEIDDFLFHTDPNKIDNNSAYLGNIFSYEIYINFKKEVDSPPPVA